MEDIIAQEDNLGKWYFLSFSGNLHRLDGPALDYNNGIKRWYINGTVINCSSQEEFEKSEEYRRWMIRAFE